MVEQKIQLPAQLGKYTLDEFLGGDLAHLYRARDSANRKVIVKILSPAACKDKETRARFLREARMAGNLSHENVIAVFDFGEEQGRPYMVMESLDGEDLASAIKNGHTGGIPKRLDIACQLAKAFEAIHAANIIHRDLKPENIQLTSGGKVKLTDFGLAKSVDLSLTRPGFALGTPYYMAPEQVLGQEITGRVDVYGFGLLLYELMTGSKAVTGASIEEIFRQVVQQPLNVEALRKAGIPEPVTNLIARCTAKKPAERIQTFAEIRAELEGILLKLSAPRKAIPGWALLAAALAGLALLMIVYLAVRSRKPGPPPPTAVEKPQPQAVNPAAATDVGDMALVPGGNFYIDKAEVSKDAYARFCEATGHALPAGFTIGNPDGPVSNVTIIDAQAFARWAGKRLPTAEEWDQGHVAGKLSEFVDGAQKPPPGLVKYFQETLHAPSLAGEPWYAVRGGSFRQPMVPARYKSPEIAFRCARNP